MSAQVIRAFSKVAGILWLTLLGMGAGLGWQRFKVWRASRTRGKPALSEREQAAALAKSWRSLEAACDRADAGAPWADVARAYEALSGAVFDLLDRLGAGGARAMSRAEMAERLAARGSLVGLDWGRFEKLLEYTETVRFAIQTGLVTEADARKALRKWVAEAKYLEKASSSRVPPL